MTPLFASRRLILALLCGVLAPVAALAQVAIRGETVHTMAGPSLEDGIVVIENGKITAVGRFGEVTVPEGIRVLQAKVVTPGLVDPHGIVGLSGIYNVDHDQDQLERSDPIQPELRAIDAYNAQEQLIEWVRSFGVTTVHTGHAPGELISGQTAVVKMRGKTVDDAVVVPTAMVAATLGRGALKEGEKSPGTRGKMMALLRAELIKAREYAQKRAGEDEEKRPPQDLGLDVLGRVLARELPLLITAHRVQDIANALRLAEEFGFRLVLDGASECYLLLDEIKAAGASVVLHPTMWRSVGEAENLSWETASKLREAGILFAIQSGYEAYVPKTRVVLFEAALAAAHGLGFEGALRSITIDSARILGVESRVGSLEVGKDGDVALYDGDPFEYTSHCVGAVIDGVVVSEEVR